MSSSRRARSRHLKRVLGNILIAILAVIALVLLVGLFLPRSYHLERTIDIQADTETIYPDLASLRRWPEWTAWNKGMDPAAEFKFGTPETGVGAEYSWSGPVLGQGRLKLTKTDPAKGIEYSLEFENGSMTSEGAITMEKVAGVIRVTWVDRGDLGRSPVNRYFGLLMDSLVGPNFEKGLQTLKSRAEAAAKSAPAIRADPPVKTGP